MERYNYSDVRDVLPLITAPTLVLNQRTDPISRPSAPRTWPSVFPTRSSACSKAAVTTCRWTRPGLMRSRTRSSSSSPDLPRRLEPRIGSSRPCCSPTSQVQPNGPRRSATQAGKTSSPRTTGSRYQVVGACGGRIVKSTGDGLLATFDGPGRGVDAAMTLVRDATALGLSVRAGLHTGEIVVNGDDVSGVAVHLASRIESAAEPGTVLVSSTVVDLVVGSGHDFTPAGRRTFAGIAHEWDVFIATR